ncbi:MAG: hypothetical protein COA39_012115 [Sulfurimonas sp.]|nr:hypothetical protein [Sulfurimonas sp.]
MPPIDKIKEELAVLREEYKNLFLFLLSSIDWKSRIVYFNCFCFRIYSFGIHNATNQENKIKNG